MDAKLPQHVNGAILADLTGSVVQTVGLTAAVADFPAPVGALVSIERQSGPGVEGQVVGFRDKHTLVMPLSNLDGIRRGNPVKLVRTTRTLRVGEGLLGRVIDARGRCIDGRPQPMLSERVPFQGEPLSPTERPPIDAPLTTGVRAIDGLLTCGRGQRLGIFAGSGIGKSALLGMMGRYTNADVSVIALIGERGREVNEFVQRELGPAGLARSVVVVATSNEPALLRIQAAYAATSIAEYFRSAGKDVLLAMDSITRFALAQREIGLSAGEPPTTRGYPPSVFSQLPKLVERTGRSAEGSITAFYSVLVEGDDENEPIADTMRGLLDGHVWLSRRLAERGHYPAIDVLRSISRLMSDVASPEDVQAAQTVRQMLAVLHENEDLLSIGAYRTGSNRQLDVAVAMRDELDALLQQPLDQQVSWEKIRAAVIQLAQQCTGQLGDSGAHAAGNRESS
ncbi:MAG: FliI/YscN family ATPase [Pirellulales bacterium]|nr:FliI/YscN family ATPase [Pirellulales bacterium]